jgi:hypothetical protein
LRERISTTLAWMKDNVTEIESNMMEYKKLKIKFYMGTIEPMCFKEQAGPSGFGQNSLEEKMNEMAKIIKDL